MENSIVKDNIFTSIKSQISEVYEETKKNINIQSCLIQSTLNQIKIENESFYTKCLEIINLTEKEKESYSGVMTPFDTIHKASNTKAQYKPIQSAKGNHSPRTNQNSHSTSKTKQGKKIKLHSSTPINFYPLSKTTTSTEISKQCKIEKPKTCFNIHNVKRQETYNKQGYVLNHLLSSSKTHKYSSKGLYQNTHTNLNHNFSVNASKYNVDNPNNKTDNEILDLKREDLRKMTTNDTRKFSIIDVPCLNIEEVTHTKKRKEVSTKETPKSSYKPKLKYCQLPISTQDTTHNTNNDLNNQPSIQGNLTQLCYIMAKEK